MNKASQSFGSDESVCYSDSYESSDDESLKSVDKFLMRLPQFDYITDVKVYSLLFKGTFKYFSDAMAMSSVDKSVVKDLFTENIFHDSFGMSVIKLTHKEVPFLMQPHVWNMIEMEKELLLTGYNEVCFRLSKKNEIKDLESNSVLFRFGIPLAFEFLFIIDYVYDSKDEFKIRLSYKNKGRDMSDSSYNDYSLTLPATSFIDFLSYCPFLGFLLTNSCLTDNTDNPSYIPPSQKFGNEVNDYLMRGRSSPLDVAKHELSVKRVYAC